MVTEFQKRVYALCRQIPKGKVTTYKELGKALGKGQVYRAVGRALRDNKHYGVIPCYKVVKSSGEISGYFGSDPTMISKKIKLLEADNILIFNKKIDLSKYLYKFK